LVHCSYRLQLLYVDVHSSVLAILHYDEKATKISNIYDVQKILGFQSELKSLLEAKQVEGKKGSKDKTPIEPGVLDLTLLTEVYIMQHVPADLLKKAISYSFCSNQISSKKGFILDIWEKNLLDDLSQFQEWKYLFVGDEREKPVTSVDLVIELIVSFNIYLLLHNYNLLTFPHFRVPKRY
jgi:hypothetical protein